MKTQKRNKQHDEATPLIEQRAAEIQAFGRAVKLPIALSKKVCARSADNLNQLLADTITLRDLYKKHHWQVAGHTFYQLHLLFDKHFKEQNELIDTIAERIQSLGAISIAMAADVAETTMIPRPPPRTRGSSCSDFTLASRSRDDSAGSAVDGEAGK